MPIVSTRANAAASAYGWSVGEELGGLVLIPPSSLTVSGTGSSGSITVNGSISFTSCTELLIDGVFSAKYDNYMVVIRSFADTADTNVLIQMRASGTTATTNYIRQELLVSNTSYTAVRNTAQSQMIIGNSASTRRSGDTMFLYGPFLAQPTVARNVSVSAQSGGFISDIANSHFPSVSYDGFRLSTNISAITGSVSVYGFVGA